MSTSLTMFASTCSTGVLRVEGMSPQVESLGWSSRRGKLARTYGCKPITEGRLRLSSCKLLFEDRIEGVTGSVECRLDFVKGTRGSKRCEVVSEWCT